jgi:methylenetetrahydrofolate reductase (NADPH)
MYLVELLTPKLSDTDTEAGLESFAGRYRKIVDAGMVVSVPDNPMGVLRFAVVEVLKELGLPVDAGQFLLHVNTFHTKQDLDDTLREAAELGVRNVLVVSGDGGERLAKLRPELIGSKAKSVTSEHLLEYINRDYSDVFNCGVAFNPYEPAEHELEKMRRKKDAGAKFIVTQPVIGNNDNILGLISFDLPVYVGAWMSKNVDLLSKCVGYAVTDGGHYDPVENLAVLRAGYPGFGLYLSMMGFKTQFQRFAASRLPSD